MDSVRGKEEQSIETLIAEYLSYHDFSKTIGTLSEEVKGRGRTLTYGTEVNPGKLQDIKKKMLNAFEKGDSVAFFELWKTHVAAHMVSKKMEFYVQVYFAIFPIHPSLKKRGSTSTPQAAMARFEEYLKTEGSGLSKTPNFLSFYALPYVPDPINHPSFNQLFLGEWAPEVQSRLDSFLTDTIKATEPTSSTPRLYEMLKSNRVQTADTGNVSKLQNERERLAQIAVELYQQLESIVQERKIPSANFMNKFSGRMKGLLPTLPSEPATPSKTMSLTARQAGPLAPLDYKKITADLLSSSLSVENRASILQALTWRISQSQPGKGRRHVLITYQESDLLGLKGSSKTKVFRTLINDRSPLLREYVLRLVNQMASEYVGRNYILENYEVLPALNKALRAETADSIMRQQALGAMQKLSLRRAAQEQMIDLDTIKWLVQILGNHDSLSSYTLEYATALLMNLSLRSAGRARCAKTNVLDVLNSLLENENPRVRTFVNGSLYSVLSVSELREKARAQGLEDFLNHLIENTDDGFRDQFQFILDKLMNDEDDGERSDEEDDNLDDEDSAVVEEEFSEENLVTGPQGEALLCIKYLATAADASAEVETVRKSMEMVEQQQVRRSRNKPTPQNRPTTPSRTVTEPAQRKPAKAKQTNSDDPDFAAFVSAPKIARD